MASSQARGVIYIHSAPRALCPHLEWAVGRALGRAVSFDWDEQPILSGSRRAEFYWEGTTGTGAALATAMRGWEHLRFEVSEDPTPRSDGGRWMHTPGLGIHYAQTDTAGNVVIGEDRVRYAIEVAAGERRRASARARGRTGRGLGRGARAVPPRERRRAGRLAAQSGLIDTPQSSQGSVGAEPAREAAAEALVTVVGGRIPGR